MISKITNVVKVEQLKKQFNNDGFHELNFKVLLQSGKSNGSSISTFDPSLELIAMTGWHCVRLFGYKLEFCISLFQFNQEFKQIQFLNGSGFLFLLSKQEFIMINLNHHCNT